MKRISLPLLCLFLCACEVQEIGNSKDVNPETIYQHYSLESSESAITISARAQFRFAGPKGTTLVLAKNSSISINGKTIGVDSSKYSGAFYPIELQKKFGQLMFTYTDATGKQYDNTCNFQPFSLATPLPATIDEKPLSLIFNGLSNGDALNLQINDTAFSTGFIDTTITYTKNPVVIPAYIFKASKPGPLTISIINNRTLPLKAQTAEGGVIEIKYRLNDLTTNLVKTPGLKKTKPYSSMPKKN